MPSKSDERTGRYKQLEFRDHCLKRPHNYGMNVAPFERSEWAWDGEMLYDLTWYRFGFVEEADTSLPIWNVN